MEFTKMCGLVHLSDDPYIPNIYTDFNDYEYILRLFKSLLTYLDPHPRLPSDVVELYGQEAEYERRLYALPINSLVIHFPRSAKRKRITYRANKNLSLSENPE